MNLTKYFKKKIVRLIIILALLGVLSLTLVFAKGLYNIIFWKTVRIERIENEISAAVRKMETLIEFSQNAPHELATILEIHGVNRTESEILLKSILFNSPEFSGVSICYEPYKKFKDSIRHSSFLYKDGDSSIFTGFNDPEDSYFYKDWYLIPKTLMKPVWSEPYYNEIDKKTLNSTYSVPFSYFNGIRKEFKGIVSLNLNVNALIDYSEHFGKSMNGFVLLISENGTILSSNNSDWIFNETIFSLASEYEVPLLREVGRDLQRGKKGRASIERFNNQTDLVVFYSPITTNKWGFLLFLPQSEIEK